MRRIVYVSGTRADYGLMEHALRRMNERPELDVSVCVTGMHLLDKYGLTVREVETSGIRIHSRIPVNIDGTTGAVMSRAIGEMIVGMTNAFVDDCPELVMVLGDRGEMLAGTIAALHLNIPVIHVHGGERSGTVDEPVRHAISKLAHYHFVTTQGARDRLVRMGERPEHIFVVGAPGLDGVRSLVSMSRETLCRSVGFDEQRPLALVVFHPVHQEADEAGRQMHEVMRAVLEADMQVMCLKPNSDAGGAAVEKALADYEKDENVRITVHMARREYLSWMAAVDVMVGNSSSGIIEAATFGLGVVNVGSRQRNREHGENVLNVPCVKQAILDAVRKMLCHGGWVIENPYGGGQAGERIAELVCCLPVDGEILHKTNAY